MNKIYIEVRATRDDTERYILRLDKTFSRFKEGVWSMAYKGTCQWLLFNWAVEIIEFVRLVPEEEIPSILRG